MSDEKKLPPRWKLDEAVSPLVAWARGPWRVVQRPSKAGTWRAIYRLADGSIGVLLDRSGTREAWWHSAGAARDACDWVSTGQFVRGFEVRVMRLDEFGHPCQLVESVETPLAQDQFA